MISYTFVLITVLATWQAIEIWHHSQLFATWRARAENWTGYVGLLLVCPFCLSPWVAAILWCLLWLAEWLGRRGFELVSAAVALPITALAISRLANLGNDVFKQFCRTPGSGDNYADRPADEEKENLDE